MRRYKKEGKNDANEKTQYSQEKEHHFLQEKHMAGL